MKIAAIIPARFASKRLPQKMLLDKTGKPLIQHTYEQALKVEGFDEIIVATDDELILKSVKSFNGNAVMTDKEHKSGSDRIAEVVKDRPDIDVIINLQGDEPEINPDDLQALADLMKSEETLEMATLACRCPDDEINNPSAVKVVIDCQNFALYFSRAAIPYNRDSGFGTRDSGLGRIKPNPKPRTPDYYRHIGVYAYSRETLLKLTKMQQTPLEKAEKLEQLRALENHIKIKVIVVEEVPKGIDTIEDYEKFVLRIKSQK